MKKLLPLLLCLCSLSYAWDPLSAQYKGYLAVQNASAYDTKFHIHTNDFADDKFDLYTTVPAGTSCYFKRDFIINNQPFGGMVIYIAPAEGDTHYDKGYFNGIYITGNLNISLSSSQNEDDYAGHRWAGNNLGTICTGGKSGNFLDNRWGSKDKHHTTKVSSNEYLDACGTDSNEMLLYTYSGTGYWSVPPVVSYTDVKECDISSNP